MTSEAIQAAVASAMAGYLLGSIPAGYFAGRVAGVDIRRMGSGNIGATNVMRTLGKQYGYAVFAFDVLKGFSAVVVAGQFVRWFHSESSGEWIRIVAAVSVVIGHSYPVWLRFRGGKGVATSAGALLALVPIAAGIAFAVWSIVFLTSRYVSVASIAAAVALPIAVAIVLHFERSPDRLLLYFVTTLSIVVLIRHRSNFARLINGTEQRFERK